MKNKNMLTRILEIILVMCLLGIAILIGLDLYDANKLNKTSIDIINKLDNEIQNNIETENLENTNNEDIIEYKRNENKKTSVTINKAEVFGKIKISKIKLEYAIFEYTEDLLKNSVCKISDNKVNGKGNLCLAAHNMRNGTLFGKLNKANVGDTIEVTNIYGETYIYIVNNVEEILVEDNSFLQNTNESIITLLTCCRDSKKRLIVQGELQ